MSGSRNAKAWTRSMTREQKGVICRRQDQLDYQLDSERLRGGAELLLAGRVGLFTKESYTKSEAMRRWFCIKWPVLKLEKKIVWPQTSLICIKADLLGNYIGVYILYFWSWGHGYTKVYSSLYNSLKICTCLKFSIVKKKKTLRGKESTCKAGDPGSISGEDPLEKG